jgi:hypothetical protein
MDEKIKGIPGFPDYSASKDGKIFRTYFRNRMTSHPIAPRELHQSTDSGGYKKVNLCKKDIGTTHLVHKLILLTFIGQCPYGYEAGHFNGIKADNRIENLRWITKEENESHKLLHGTDRSVGNKNPKAKLNEEKVIAIRMQLATTLKQREIAKYYGVSEQVISDIKHHRRWCHV